MGASMKTMLLLLLIAAVCGSSPQSNISSKGNKLQQQHPSLYDDTIRFNTKTKDSCTMAVSAAGNFTRLRVSCRSQSQATGRSYYCDFQGKPTQCQAYNNNPRHYFTQMMWELRKLKNACQGAKIYRPHMCRKYSVEAQMTFLTSWPKASSSAKPQKPIQEQRKAAVPLQDKASATHKPVEPHLPKLPDKSSQSKRSTPKPVRSTTLPTETAESSPSRLATQYCWKSFHGLCRYAFSWFQD